MIRNGILVALVVLLFGCSRSEGEVNFEELKNIEIGMNISKVHSTMTNDPIDLEEAYWSDSLLVENYQSGFGASDYYKIIYSKSDSTVTEIRWGD